MSGQTVAPRFVLGREAAVSLVIAKQLSLAFGKKTILEEASFSLNPTDRIGLVGANGTGKSTLLRVLVGQVPLDKGTLTFRRRMRVGYLPQDLTGLPEGTVLQSVLSAVPGRDTLDERLSSTEQQLTEAKEEAEQLELAGLLADLHEEADHFEARYGRHRAERILLGLGFSRGDFDRDATELSGGWRMRAALAGLLLQDPDLLLLDEPTNHLDLPTLAWFDGFLKRSHKAMVLISHDREFLDRHVSRIMSLEMEGLRTWVGNYQDYQRLRAEEVERLLAQSERQAQKRAQLQEFVDRFRAKATKAAQAQSKMKQIEKMEVIEVREERNTMGFRFPPAPSSGREVVRLEALSKAFGSRVVYDATDAQVLKGQRIAVVGVNGAGKTTLLKLLAGELPPDSGRVVMGHQVILGYFAQHHAETLDPHHTILQELSQLVPDKPQSFVRSVLGSFLFSGDDVDKPIGVLSGGERARVALARLLLKPANLLVMDEPTNHLDLDSSEALIEALETYSGTLIFVSHNRSFLNALATHVWDVRAGKVVPYPGNLDDYLHHLELESAARDQEEDASEADDEARKPTEKERKRVEAEARQARSVRATPLKKEIAQLEARIAQLETLQAERERQLGDPGFSGDYAKARPVMDAHRQDGAELERLLARWEAASTELSSLG